MSVFDDSMAALSIEDEHRLGLHAHPRPYCLSCEDERSRREQNAELTAVRAQLAETERQRDACGAEALQLRKAFAAFIDEAGCSNSCPPDDMTCATNRANTALAAPSESAKWLAERINAARAEAVDLYRRRRVMHRDTAERGREVVTFDVPEEWLAEHNERIVSAAVAKVQEHTVAALEEAVAQVAEIDRLRMQLAEAESGRADADRVAEEHRAARDEVRAEVERLKAERNEKSKRLADALGEIELTWEAAGNPPVRGLTTLPDVVGTHRAEQLELRAEVERQRTVIAGLVDSVTLAVELLRRPKHPHNRAENALSVLDAALAAANGTPAPTKSEAQIRAAALKEAAREADAEPEPAGPMPHCPPEWSVEDVARAAVRSTRSAIARRIRALAASPAPKTEDEPRCNGTLVHSEFERCPRCDE